MTVLRIGLVALAFAIAGCSGKGATKAPKPPFIHPQAVVTASYQNDNSKSPVLGNHSNDKDGNPERYEGAAQLVEGKVEFYYEYVGSALAPVDELTNNIALADVYVFRVRMILNGPWLMIPFVFRGRNDVVFSRDGLVIEMKEE